MTLLFESWYSSLVRYAWRATGSFETAEDLVQEAFMDLYRELRRGTTIDNPKAWTLVVARRKVGKHTRGRSMEVVEDLDSLPATPAGVELDDVTKLLWVLSPREEEVLLLRMGGLKYEEIASQLGITANSVNTLLARALRKLQKAAGTKPGDPPSGTSDRPSTRGARNAHPKTLQ